MPASQRTAAIALNSRFWWLLAAIVVAAFALRLHVAVGSTYHHDEEREWIPFAESISLEPGNINLPVRVISHPILPAYLIAFGSVIGGENPFGFRLMSLLAGTGTVLIVGLMALAWRGPLAAVLASSLLAFNEYHIYVSTLAIDKPFQLFFVALAMWAFIRFLQSGNTRALYLAGGVTGVAFLCKETTGLLLPGFLLLLLLSAEHRRWLLRPAPYIAVLIFALVISPDLMVNLFMADQLEFTYADHLQRAAGFGFERNHLLFFFRDAIRFVYDLRGEPLRDLAPEYASMNSVLGAILLGVASWSVLALASSKEARRDAVALYLTIAFWVVFGFFLFTEVSTEGALEHLTYVAWFWSDLTLIPGAVLAGAFLAGLAGILRFAGLGIAGVGVLIAASAAIVNRVDTPRGPSVGFDPEYILPPDGRDVDVRAFFHFCAVCDSEVEPDLVDIRIHEPDGATYSVLGTERASRAPDSEDGMRFRVRARDAMALEGIEEPWQEVMWYEVVYELTYRDGSKQIVEDRVFSRLTPSEFPPRFWAMPSAER